MELTHSLRRLSHSQSRSDLRPEGHPEGRRLPAGEKDPWGRASPSAPGAGSRWSPSTKPSLPHPTMFPAGTSTQPGAVPSGDWKAKLSQRPLNLSWEKVSIPEEACFNASFTLTCSLRPRWGLGICTFSSLPGRLQSQRSGGTCGHRAGQSRAQDPSPKAAYSPLLCARPCVGLRKVPALVEEERC